MWLSVVLLIKLLCVLPEYMIQIQARQTCEVGRGKYQNHAWRWVITPKDPCKCTRVRIVSGLNKDTPSRPFEPVDVDIPVVGGHDCNCNAGFRRDGFTCTDVDECLSGPCDSNATCSNNPGSYDCTCNTGFIGDGFNCSDIECYSDALGADYRGTVAVTKTSKTCQNWTEQVPHQHEVTPDNYPGIGLEDHNYCRNPDNEPKGTWCYTIDEELRWEYCDIGSTRFCGNGDNECYSDANGGDYRGRVAITRSGNVCQKWTEQVPHVHTYYTLENYPESLGDHNYCRNPYPDDGPGGAWCYTTNEEVRFEYCDIHSSVFCLNCSEYLGMESGEIRDEDITAMTSIRPATNARLNGDGTWSADSFNFLLSSLYIPTWIQANIGNQTYVSGVITQGDGGVGISYNWVTSFKVSTFLSTNDT
ncbi:prothrombin-like, partial [Amphiura filiformis]|uniref:prothrombin-like n=1 Tax=Amphiura filiformis TaxID=82378 RepID=UPI003B213B4C